MKKLLLIAIFALTAMPAFAKIDYTYCKKFSDIGGKAVDIRSQGFSKQAVIDELDKVGALTMENKSLIDLVYLMPLTSDLDGDIANLKRVVFSICMDSVEVVK